MGYFIDLVPVGTPTQLFWHAFGSSMLQCDNADESLRREWEGKIKLVLLLISPVLLASRTGVEPLAHTGAEAYSKYSLFYIVGVMAVAKGIVRDLNSRMLFKYKEF